MKTTKFRRLTLAELTDVRDQFVKWLALNGISADHWQKIKAEEPQRMDALILQFSQVVFAGVIDQIEYLVHRKPHDLRTYKTDQEKIFMQGVLLDGETTVDLTDNSLTPQQMFERLKSEGVPAKLYSAERAYLPIGRDQDIFRILEEGALIDGGELFRTLEQVSRE